MNFCFIALNKLLLTSLKLSPPPELQAGRCSFLHTSIMFSSTLAFGCLNCGPSSAKAQWIMLLVPLPGRAGTALLFELISRIR